MNIVALPDFYAGTERDRAQAEVAISQAYRGESQGSA